MVEIDIQRMHQRALLQALEGSYPGTLEPSAHAPRQPGGLVRFCAGEGLDFVAALRCLDRLGFRVSGFGFRVRAGQQQPAPISLMNDAGLQCLSRSSERVIREGASGQ